MSKRSSMLASAVRKAIAPILRECPRECGMVTITELHMSEDLGVATVYISALAEPKLALDFLEQSKGRLRTMLASLEQRRVPELRFRHDPRSERGSRIEELLK